MGASKVLSSGHCCSGSHTFAAGAGVLSISVATVIFVVDAAVLVARCIYANDVHLHRLLCSGRGPCSEAGRGRHGNDASIFRIILTSIQGGPLELSGMKIFEFPIIGKSFEISVNPSVSG